MIMISLNIKNKQNFSIISFRLMVQVHPKLLYAHPLCLHTHPKLLINSSKSLFSCLDVGYGPPPSLPCSSAGFSPSQREVRVDRRFMAHVAGKEVKEFMKEEEYFLHPMNIKLEKFNRVFIGKKEDYIICIQELKHLRNA